jgi:hypothetical protein
MDVRMKLEALIPGMEHAEETDLRAKGDGARERSVAGGVG